MLVSAWQNSQGRTTKEPASGGIGPQVHAHEEQRLDLLFSSHGRAKKRNAVHYRKVSEHIVAFRGCCHRTVRVPMINPSTAKVHTMGTVSIRTRIWEQWRDIDWSDEYGFLLDQVDGRVRVCCSPEEEMAAGCTMEESRLVEAVLCLLRNLRSWHVTLTHTTTYKYCCRPWTLLMAMCSLMAITSFRSINVMFEQCLRNMECKCLRNMEKCSRCCLGLQNSPDFTVILKWLQLKSQLPFMLWMLRDKLCFSSVWLVYLMKSCSNFGID